MPSDRCRIKKYLRALQRRQPRALGIPLVPADQRADFSRAGIECTKAEIAGREIKFFVIERVVRDVHLAIKPAQGTVVIKNSRRVVIKPRRALLKQRCDQHHSVGAGGGGKFFGTRPRNRFGQIEQCVIFALAEILRLKKFGQADDFGAASGRVRDAFDSLGKILLRLRTARHLHQRHAKFFRRQDFPPPRTL